MNVLIVYIQKIFALFLLLVVARQLIPNGRLKKYIYFFTELVLIIGVMQPFFLFGGIMMLCLIRSGLKRLRKI